MTLKLFREKFMTSMLKDMDSPITSMTIIENAPNFFFREIVNHKFLTYPNISAPHSILLSVTVYHKS